MNRTSRVVIVSSLLCLAAARTSAAQGREGPAPSFQPFKTVWEGVYTKAEAERGKTAYAELCARCHGAGLKGGASSPALAGAAFFDRWHDLRLGDVVAYIQAAMPRAHEFYIAPDKARDITALILAESGIPAGQTVMPGDPDTLAAILITRPVVSGRITGNPAGIP